MLEIRVRERRERAQEERAPSSVFCAVTVLLEVLLLVSLFSTIVLDNSPTNSQFPAEVLEYQPLALAAAAVYVQTIVSCGTPNYGWTKYLETLNSEEREAREDLFAKKKTEHIPKQRRLQSE